MPKSPLLQQYVQVYVCAAIKPFEWFTAHGSPRTFSRTYRMTKFFVVIQPAVNSSQANLKQLGQRVIGRTLQAEHKCLMCKEFLVCTLPARPAFLVPRRNHGHRVTPKFLPGTKVHLPFMSIGTIGTMVCGTIGTFVCAHFACSHINDRGGRLFRREL